MPSTKSSVPALQILMSGLAFGESPRWHADRLWFSDWGAHEVIAVNLEGKSEVIVRVPSFPMCIDFLPDGRLLIVSTSDGLLLRREGDGALVTHADLTGLADHKWNDIVVDGRGNAYVNNVGFDFPGGEFAPGSLALVTPDGSARQVAEGVAFPVAWSCEHGRRVTNGPGAHRCCGARTGRRLAIGNRARRSSYHTGLPICQEHLLPLSPQGKRG